MHMLESNAHIWYRCLWWDTHRHTHISVLCSYSWLPQSAPPFAVSRPPPPPPSLFGRTKVRVKQETNSWNNDDDKQTRNQSAFKAELFKCEREHMKTHWIFAACTAICYIIPKLTFTWCVCVVRCAPYVVEILLNSEIAKYYAYRKEWEILTRMWVCVYTYSNQQHRNSSEQLTRIKSKNWMIERLSERGSRSGSS